MELGTLLNQQRRVLQNKMGFEIQKLGHAERSLNFG